MAQLPVENKDIGSRIRAIEAELEDTNPQLYRHLALYLQVLRQVLPHRLEQACFHLATQWHAHRYINLESSRRQLLQRRLQELTQRCSSLLTVEQLAVPSAPSAATAGRRVGRPAGARPHGSSAARSTARPGLHSSRHVPPPLRRAVRTRCRAPAVRSTRICG